MNTPLLIVSSFIVVICFLGLLFNCLSAKLAKGGVVVRFHEASKELLRIGSAIPPRDESLDCFDFQVGARRASQPL